MPILNTEINAFIEIELGRFADDNYPKGGRNGPYNDFETPARNISHWIIILAKMKAKEKNHDRITRCIEKLADRLILDSDLRPYGFTYHARSKPGKDYCNGVIGSAWIAEGLHCAYESLGDKKYLEAARQLLCQYDFDHSVGMFNVKEIHGKNIGIDYTFNHQLWLVMAFQLIGTAANDQKMLACVREFFDLLPSNLRIRANGRIVHGCEHRFSRKLRLKRVLQKARRRNFKKPEIPVEKEIGYHTFNTYAFAVLRDSGFNHKFWDSVVFEKILSYLDSREFQENIYTNRYSLPYNPPGYEIVYTKEVFGRTITDFDKKLLRTQINDYLLGGDLVSRGVKDVSTQVARFYEACRIKGDYL